MAFISPTPLPTRTRTHNPRTHARTSRPLAAPIKSTAAANRPKTQSPPSVRPHRSAPVIDNHISSVVENHHWIVVRPDRRRLFERAAVAHADMTRQVERRTGTGAAHRWVLRAVRDLAGGTMAVTEGTYVVMETYAKRVPRESPQVMRRWLSAVERVAPMMATLDIRTRGYENLFTSRLHSRKYDPNQNVVVMESVNVEYGNEEEVRDVLQEVAEKAVSRGACLEFSVLRKPGKVGFYKILQVFRDDDSLKQHMDGLDKEFDRRVQGKTAGGARNRQMFRPVVFA